MVTLEVQGPYEISFDKNRGKTKRIGKEHGRGFFDEHDALADRRGCYLFGIRTKGLRAVYVGKATQNFAQEVFAVDKLNKYNDALHEESHGTPVMLFVVTPTRIHSEKLITDVEEYLIRSAKRVWPGLLNKHHAGADDWKISGVTAAHRGRRSASELALMQLLKLGDG